MQLSYWEHRTWFSEVDFTIIGSGIVGLNCALELRKNHPFAKILVLERGSLPHGASTKNAGFACFGSISELLSDLGSHSRDEVVQLVQKRWDGIARLRKILGDKNIGYQGHGGHELFALDGHGQFEACLARLGEVNGMLEPVFGEKPFKVTDNIFGFDGVHPKYITHSFEGQIDTGKMMQALIQKCQERDIPILNGIEVLSVSETGSGATLGTEGFEFDSRKVFVAT